MVDVELGAPALEVFISETLVFISETLMSELESRVGVGAGIRISLRKQALI